MKLLSKSVPEALRLAVLAAASATVFLAVSEPAASQPPASQTAASQPATTETTLAEVTVTGSLISQTAGFQAPTPVTTSSALQLAATNPTDVSDALKELPQFQGQTSGGSGGATGLGGGTFGDYLNLRALGSNRTLVLIDGNRVAEGTATGGVDAAQVPQLLMQRVDVITGGASAAYGSDAIAGVVNFILDKDFNGVKGVVGYGRDSRGDMPNSRIGLAAGDTFADGRLHLEASVEYYNNGGIPSAAAYPYGLPYSDGSLQAYQAQNTPVYGGLYGPNGPNGALPGSAANPYVLYPNGRYGSISVIGFAASGPIAGMSILNGQLVPHTETLVSGGSCIQCPNEMTLATGTTPVIVPSLRNDQLFGRADFKINDNVSLFGEVISYDSTQNSGRGADMYNFFNINIFSGNPYLPASVQSSLTATATPSFVWSQTLSKSYFPTSGNGEFTDSKALNVFAGVEGGFGASWQWNFTATDSRYDQLTNQPSSVAFPREAAAIDAVVNPANGQIVCRITLTNPTLYPGCQPLDIFGFGNQANPQAAAFIGQQNQEDVVSEMKMLQARITGSLVSLWAGDLKGAAGVGYRRESINVESTYGFGGFPTEADPEGIRGLDSNSLFTTGNVPNENAANEVKEGFAELFVPLAKDIPFIRSANLDGAVRFTDYTYGGFVTTWKGSLDWAIDDQVRLRGTVSRDIRAPSLGELFSGQARSPIDITDNYSGKTVLENVTVIAGSNPNLKPERSLAKTGGIVFQPHWLDGLQLSVDYWQFNIKDEINTPYTPQQIVTFCDQSNGTGPTCALLTRPYPSSNHSADNIVLTVTSILQNSAATYVDGIDTELDYQHPLFAGRLSFRGLLSYLDQYYVTNAPGQPSFVYAGNADYQGGLPHLRTILALTYSQGPWSVQATERIIGSLEISRIYTVIGDNLPTVYYTDLNATYDLKAGDSTLQIYGNVRNLFNTSPPFTLTTLAYGGESSGYPVLPIYDIQGTFINAGVRFKF